MLPRLGVNIDHVATLRQLRGTPYPDLVQAAHLVQEAGAHQITIHLREDRRHIQDCDVHALMQAKAHGKADSRLMLSINLEMAATPAMFKFAARVKPEAVCIVPERRQEQTTEGGLDVKRAKKVLAREIPKLQTKGIRVSLFIEPEIAVVNLAAELRADAVEFHTGRYCLLTQKPKPSASAIRREFHRMVSAARQAQILGLEVHAGHGLDDENVRPLAALEPPLFEEFNIGHWIVCRAALVGMVRAVREMKSAIEAP